MQTVSSMSEQSLSTNQTHRAAQGDLSHIVSCFDGYDPDAMSVEKAKAFLRKSVQELPQTEMTSLRHALNRVLSSPIVATLAVPAHDNSAMDGYAFHASMLDMLAQHPETNIPVVGTVYAGKPFDGEVASGCCVRIMTGAKMPSGTNTVVPQEHVTVDKQPAQAMIRLRSIPKAFANVRLAGEDIQRGQQILDAGHRLHAADIGLLASLGIAKVSVYKKIRVAFFSTGDELVGLGQPLQAGQIYDSNRYTLHAMLEALGVEIIDMGAIPDRPELLEQTLHRACEEADVVISTGGVSVGEADHMKMLLEKLGQAVFWKIAMKPGRPLAYGRIGQAHYFGLPGNPVAVMVTFYQFVREVLLLLMGQSQINALPEFEVACVDAIKKAPGKTEFQRGILFQTLQASDSAPVWKVRLTGNQSSGVLSSMSAANCFIVLDEAAGNLAPGSLVKVQVFGGILGP